MFLLHIALSLELISLALGSLLVLKCCRYCCNRDSAVGTVGVGQVNEPARKIHKHFGFLKFVGCLIMILAFLGFLCSTFSYISHASKYGFDDRMYPDARSRVLDPYDQRVDPDQKVAPPLPASEVP